MLYLLTIIPLLFLTPIFTFVNYLISFRRPPAEREMTARKRWNLLKRSNGLFFVSLIAGLVIILFWASESLSPVVRLLMSVLFIAADFLIYAAVLGIIDRKIRGLSYPMAGYLKFQTFFFAARFLAIFVVVAFLNYPFFQGPFFEGLLYGSGEIGWEFFMEIALFLAAVALFLMAILFQVRLLGRLTGAVSPMPEGTISDSVIELAGMAGIAVERVRLFVIETFDCPYFNAFAAPFKTIYFTKPLLRELDRDQLLAVSAHEIGHLLTMKRRTISVLILYLGLALFLWLITPIFQIFASGNTLLTAVVIATGILFLIFVISFRRMSQKFEAAADETAASLTGDPEHLVGALEKIYDLNMVPRRFDKRGSERETHPSLERRVAALKGEDIGKPKRSILRILVRSLFFIVLLIFLFYIFLGRCG